MSSLIVEVTQIETIAPHAGADRLELGTLKGWQCVVPKGKYKAGDLVTYIPVDSVISEELATRLGVANYLGVNGRVRCAKLRGEPSFGLIIDRENPEWGVGTDVAAHYGITKYIPPVKISAGDAAADNSLFVKYTNIEHLKNFNRIFSPGEPVVATEKIHGSNCRVGICLEDGQMIEMAGSREHRRRRPLPDAMAGNIYWHAWTVPGVREMLQEMVRLLNSKQVILFGEVYGKTQSLRYGVADLAFRAFDLLIDGEFVSHDDFAIICERFAVPTSPVVYDGPFDLDALKAAADGRSVVPGADNIREGLVVRPLIERVDPRLGRVICKLIGDSYAFGKNISDTADV